MTPAAAPLLEARGLTRHYRVSRGVLRGTSVVRALDGVSFSLGDGRTLAVVGESGCGKSTLARQVTMTETPTAVSARQLRDLHIELKVAKPTEPPKQS